MSRKMTATWKATERAVARALGGERLGPTGLAQPDVVAGPFSVECKHRKTLPAWLLGAMRQAETNAAPGSLALVVLHESARRHENDLVVLRLGAFREWFGDVGKGEHE